MESYRKKVNLRLIWWWVWWSICLVFFVGNILDSIFILLSGLPSGFIFLVKIFSIAFFSVPVFLYVPSKQKLIDKDLKKDPDNQFANLLALELKVSVQERQDKQRQESESISKQIKEMEKKLSENESNQA
tara:strand:+ start:288 stop:677 length:390 start_codon:yes stop_codon:yes gene_type:complete